VADLSRRHGYHAQLDAGGDLTLMKVDGEIGSHVLISDNGPVRVIAAGERWRLPEAKSLLGEG
jgi:hypothetical protein